MASQDKTSKIVKTTSSEPSISVTKEPKVEPKLPGITFIQPEPDLGASFGHRDQRDPFGGNRRDEDKVFKPFFDSRRWNDHVTIPSSSSSSYGIAATTVSATNLNVNVSTVNQQQCYQPTPQASAPLQFRLVDSPARYFHGREQEMLAIQKALALCLKSTNYLSRIAVVTGIGGIGKSELVRNFVQNHCKDYPNVAWIDAGSNQGLRDSFIRFGTRLGLCSPDGGGKDASLTLLVERIYAYLSDKMDNQVILLVFDNVDLHPNSDGYSIKDYLPKSQELQSLPIMLFTMQTRDSDLETQIGNENVIPLTELTCDDSVEFFRKYFCLDTEAAKWIDALPHFQDLARHLRGYPLAMILAAASIDNDSNLSENVRKVMMRLECGKEDLLKMEAKGLLKNYDRSLKAVWCYLVEQIEELPEKDGIFATLQVLGYIEPDNFFLQELHALSTTSLPFAKADEDCSLTTDDDETIRNAIKHLKKLAIITESSWKGSYRIHRIIQKCAQTLDPSRHGACKALLHSIKNYNYFVPSACVNSMTNLPFGAQNEGLGHLKRIYLTLLITRRGLLPDRIVEDILTQIKNCGAPHVKEENDPATEDLLWLAEQTNQLHHDRSSAEAPSKISSALDIGIKWAHSQEYTCELLQHCVLDYVYRLVYCLTLEETLDPAWTSELKIKFLTLSDQIIEDEGERGREGLGLMTHKMLRGLNLVLQQSSVTSWPSFLGSLQQSYARICGNPELRLEYWSFYRRILLVQGLRSYCEELTYENCRNMLDSMQRWSKEDVSISTGLFLCLLHHGWQYAEACLLPDLLNDLLEELAIQTRIRLNNDSWSEVDIYLWTFWVILWRQSPQSTEKKLALVAEIKSLGRYLLALGEAFSVSAPLIQNLREIVKKIPEAQAWMSAEWWGGPMSPNSFDKDNEAVTPGDALLGFITKVRASLNFTSPACSLDGPTDFSKILIAGTS